MQVELLHEKIKEALKERGVKPEEIARMSGEEVFNEFCLWEGFIGWGPALWNAVENIKAADNVRVPKMVAFGAPYGVDALKDTKQPDFSSWKGGVPEDKRGAFAVVFQNGNHNIIWDGEKPHAWQSVIAWHRIPGKPELDYNPKAFREPDYGGWVGEYSFPETSKESS